MNVMSYNGSGTEGQKKSSRFETGISTPSGQ